MSSCLLMFPGVRSFLVVSSFDLNLLPLAFSLILTEASRLLHSYSTNDKTSKLMVIQLCHGEGHPERFIDLHGEEKREEGDRGDEEEKRGNQKGRDQSSQ